MANSTSATTRRKPQFPLWLHKKTGVWCKKIMGRFHYFGKAADDPMGEAALKLWHEEQDDLLAALLRPRFIPRA